MRWPPGCRRGPGSGYRRGRAPRGHRFYDWAWVAMAPGRPGCHWLLIRCNRRTGELAFYRCWSPRHVLLAALVRIAGIRWATEENFAAGKGLAGPEEHQVRRRASWYRRVTLAMLAPACLTVTAAAGHAQPPGARPDPPCPPRDRAPDRPGRPGRPTRYVPAGLVSMAAPSPAPIPGLPLPAAGSPRPMTSTAPRHRW
jgi:hypothetical protein